MQDYHLKQDGVYHRFLLCKSLDSHIGEKPPHTLRGSLETSMKTKPQPDPRDELATICPVDDWSISEPPIEQFVAKSALGQGKGAYKELYQFRRSKRQESCQSVTFYIRDRLGPLLVLSAANMLHIKFKVSCISPQNKENLVSVQYSYTFTDQPVKDVRKSSQEVKESSLNQEH